jgi:hypothetical protein
MIQFVTALHVGNLWLQSVLAAAVVVYALLRGGPRLRGPAILTAVAWTAGTIANYMIKPVGPHLILTCAIDALAGVGLLYYTLRYDSPWLSLAVIAQGVQLALDSFMAIQWSGFAVLHRVMVSVVWNGLSDLILVGVLGFAISERRRLALPTTSPMLRPG